ncbi:hypothetical protein CDAR_176331 [Caerostris darwini]|uniref:Uncharacterized protein n=1 Tax=Caerostris darwini TaxID=1538125 RepID=A0AAV4W4N0_9ARAC|nr:hypothetical protein CDAR_176331 [Caerostris darwini]
MKYATDKVNPDSSLPNRLESWPLLSGGRTHCPKIFSHESGTHPISDTDGEHNNIEKEGEAICLESGLFRIGKRTHRGNSKNNPIQRRCPATSLIRTTAAGREAIWYFLSYSPPS